MSRLKLEQRVAELERQVGILLAERAGKARTKDWRKTKGAFSGDDLMQRVFAEGRKIRKAEGNPVQAKNGKKRQPPS